MIIENLFICIYYSIIHIIFNNPFCYFHLADQLKIPEQNLFDKFQKQNKDQLDQLTQKYLHFLNTTDVDRERVNWAINHLKEFKETQYGDNLDTDKFYYTNCGKNVAFVYLGENKEQFTIVGSHCDYPHLDLKPHFVKNLKEQGCCVLKTHYYGGIKLYQYATIPMKMKIISCLDGQTKIQTIGEDPEDPVFTVPDLLIHLSVDQGKRTLREVMKPEEMNAIASSSYGEYTKFSENFLHLLNQKTGLTEEDLPFCEFQLYPAITPRFVGLDKAIIGAPGQDDGVCTFAAVEALRQLVESGIKPKNSIIVSLHSYEETGSNGFQGAQSQFLYNVFQDILYKLNIPVQKHNRIIHDTLAISADVSAVYDANFPDAHEPLNAAVINRGIIVERYTGSGGKSGSSEAGVETLYQIRKACDKEYYQISELGKVQPGCGGGTIAKFVSESLNCQVIDIGIGVMNMHSPFELVGLGDIFAGVQVYKQLMNRQ